MDLISISSPPSPSYYCYQCTRVVTVSCPTHVVCPHCDGGFIQSVDPSDHLPQPDPLTHHHHTHAHAHSDSPRIGFTQQNRTRRTNTNTNPTTVPIPNTSSSSSFNPLVVLRSPPNESEDHRNYELYYNDGAGSGLRQLPPTMSESLLGSGFELMLDRLSQIGFNLWARPDNPPASKRAVASLPVITIGSGHVEGDFSHCAVCKDQFTLGSEAMEMPCRHIYHSDCILPWLNLHSSCPVCREELPGDEDPDVVGSGSTRPEAVGLTIWRLPGGGFAVGRFVGGGGEGEMPGVFSEVDGSLNFSGRVGRGIEWEPWMRRRRGSGLRRFFGNLGSIFRRRNGSGGSSGTGVARSRSISETGGSGNWMFGRSLTRRSRNRDSVGMER